MPPDQAIVTRFCIAGVSTEKQGASVILHPSRKSYRKRQKVCVPPNSCLTHSRKKAARLYETNRAVLLCGKDYFLGIKMKFRVRPHTLPIPDSYFKSRLWEVLIWRTPNILSHSYIEILMSYFMYMFVPPTLNALPFSNLKVRPALGSITIWLKAHSLTKYDC